VSIQDDQNAATAQTKLRTETSTTPFTVFQGVSTPVSYSGSPHSTTPIIETLEHSKLFEDHPNGLDSKVFLQNPDLLEPCFSYLQAGRVVKEPEDMVRARHAILAELPLPDEIPDDSLKPILIPSPYTLHEFLSNASGVSYSNSSSASCSHLHKQSLRTSSVVSSAYQP
jgi:hypothetical protein